MFGLWLIDTGRYAPDAINGQDFAGYPDGTGCAWTR